MIEQLIDAGADVFRINTAHGSRKSHQESIDRIRDVTRKTDRHCAILVDLAGPKIRLGQLATSPLECEAGDELHFIRDDSPQHEHELPSTYKPLVDELKEGHSVMLADGAVGLEVIDTAPDRAVCRVVSPGTIRHRQGINLPGVALSVPSITEKDRDNALWASRAGVDFVSLSFVRGPDEIHELRRLLTSHGSTAMVIAKIEKREALEHLEAIVDASDAVMVARGDLGVEIDVAETPLAQKRVIRVCQERRKPVIVATQMLDSMQQNRRPTRAEASDVANAILDGADACMLSGETAVGKYPRDAVEMMDRILATTEELLRDAPQTWGEPTADSSVHPITEAVVFGSGRIADRLNAKLVVVSSHSGETARVKAKQRDYIPTIGVSDCEATLRRMCLFWGIIPLPHAPVKDGPALREFIQDWGIEHNAIAPGDRIVFMLGSQIAKYAHNALIVHEIE
jgi:pyruvate kinase